MLLFNFLPSQHKKNFKAELITRILRVVVVFLLVWFFIFSTIFFSSLNYLTIQSTAVKERIETTKTFDVIKEAEILEQEITDLNKSIRKIKAIKDTQPYELYDFLHHLSSMVPAESNLESFNFSATGNKIVLRGHANLRTQVIIFQERLEASLLFDEIEAPLSNLLKASDIEFNFTVNLLKEG